jgi:hypothetical protein
VGGEGRRCGEFGHGEETLDVRYVFFLFDL